MTLHNVEEEARVKGILETVDQGLQLQLKLSEIVGRLSEKRVTLEEKMIRGYLHDLASELLTMLAIIHKRLSKTYMSGQDKSEKEREAFILSQAEDTLKWACELAHLQGQVEEIADNLLKVLRYNLNFLEQYYEFDFYGSLTNEKNVLAKAKELHLKLQAVKD